MKLILSLSILTFSILTIAAQKNGRNVIPVAPGRVIVTETSIVDSTQPVLIILPGIYRGMDKADPFLKLLSEENINYVSIHFSTHPASIQALAEKQELNFDGMTTQDFVDEVLTAIRFHQVSKPLIVSLSYSSTIVRYLDAKKFPLVVETSPMGKFGESNPDYYTAMKAYENWFKLNPFVGEAFAKAMKFNSYHAYWQNEVTKLGEIHPEYLNPKITEKLVLGFVAMTLAADDYTILNQDFKKTPDRFWILGENEDALRKSIQLEAVKKQQRATGDKNNLVIVKAAGHIVPGDQPEAYLKILLPIIQRANE